MKALLAIFAAPVLVALAFAFIMVLCLPFTLFNALVLTKLWLWFAVPYGAPVINVAHAYGISLLVGYFFVGVYSNLETIKSAVQDEASGFWASTGRLIQGAATTSLTCAISLLLGYIVHANFW